MYVTGWGFHTDWRNLVAASMVWKGAIRPVRLARIRHARDFANGTARVNLASLPNEVMQIIEQQLAGPTMEDILADEPFEFDDEECCEQATEACFDSAVYLDKSYEFAAENGYLTRGGGVSQAGDEAFMMSDESVALLQEAAENHANEGWCDKAETSINYWECLRSGVPYVDAHDEDMESLLIASEQAVETFARDFNLQAFRRSGGPSPCNLAGGFVTLLVSSSVLQHTQVEQQPDADPPVQKAFARSPSFLCLPQLKLLPVQYSVSGQMMDSVSPLKLVTLEEGYSNGQTILYSLFREKEKN